MLVETISGVRGIYGEEITRELILGYAAALDALLGKGPIVIGMDSRHSGPEIHKLFSQHMDREIISVGVAPTPVVSHAVVQEKSAGGIMITASHNPIDFNGWKLLGPDGAIIAEKDAAKMKAWARTLKPRTNTFPVTCKDAISSYLKSVSALIEEVKPLAGKILADPNGGAAVQLIKDSGMPFKMHHSTQGGFWRDIEPNPLSLSPLEKELKKLGCDVAAAFDCDADRVEFLTKEGICLTGNDALGILAHTMLEEGDTLVVNDATSHMVHEVCASIGAKIVEVEVGERNVVEGIARHHAVIGGEGSSGGVIFPPGKTRDGFRSLLGLMQAMQQRSLKEWLRTLPRKHYRKALFAVPHPSRAVKVLRKHYADHPQRSQQTSLKILFDDGFLWLRPSQTEWGMLVIVAEASADDLVQKRIREAYDLSQH
ncbi:MAG: hypothetical protein ABIH34_02270 [Nanoarchaeota archaeon]